MMIRVRDIKVQRLGDTVIANALGIGRASVYRVLEADSKWRATADTGLGL